MVVLSTPAGSDFCIASGQPSENGGRLIGDSDFPVFSDDRLAAFGNIDEPVISEQIGRFLFEQLEDRDCEPADLDVGGRVAAHFEEVAQSAGVGRDEDLGFGGSRSRITARIGPVR